MNNLDKAKLWAERLGKCPGIAAIFLSGSLAQGRGKSSSDIDFFILTKSGQIWTARFFAFVWLKLFGMLSKPKNHAGKICPNHFITTDNLEIEEKDAYSAHLFSHNQPLYDPENYFADFQEANQWVAQFGESFGQKAITSQKTTKNTNRFKKITESVLKNLQIWHLKRNPEYNTLGAKIVLTDTELRFHPVPKNIGWSKPTS